MTTREQWKWKCNHCPDGGKAASEALVVQAAKRHFADRHKTVRPMYSVAREK